MEGMGVPEIKYGDSVCFVQHVASGLWVTYKAQDAKTSRLGPLKRKVKGLMVIQGLLTFLFFIFYTEWETVRQE
jgi:hypothetical protein